MWYILKLGQGWHTLTCLPTVTYHESHGCSSVFNVSPFRRVISLLHSVKIHTFLKSCVGMHYNSFIFLLAMTHHDADREFVL